MNRFTLVIAFVFIAGIAHGHEEVRRADAHQHSVAQGRLAVESGELYLMLEIPGANLVGFEHPPRNEAEREVLDDALARLREGSWLVLPGKAECDPRIELEAAGFAQGSDSAHHEHGHDHHDHDAAHQHAEFGITVSATCRGGSPEWLELRLFDDWPDNRLVRVDAITESNQLRAELTADSPRIELQ